MKSWRLLLVAVIASLSSSHLAAQWIRQSVAGVPRKADGTVDMSAATPRTPDGKPDLSGIWTSDEVDPRRPNVVPNPHDATTSRRMINLGVDLPGGLPYQPWLAALVKERWTGRCRAIRRRRGWDIRRRSGRATRSSWDSIGLRDESWIDWQGSVVGEGARIREEIRRPDFGHLEVQLTIDDSKAYTKPFTVTIKERLIVEAELIDEVCLENERSLQHMK